MARKQCHRENKSLEISESHSSFVQLKGQVTAVTLSGASVGKQEICTTRICSDTAFCSAQMQDTPPYFCSAVTLSIIRPTFWLTRMLANT